MAQSRKPLKSKSKFVAQLLVRLFIIVLLVGIVPYFMDEELKEKVAHTYLYMQNKWAFVFPLMLYVSFITLLILSGMAKKQRDDYNWLLALNALILIIYMVLLYVRLYPLLYGVHAIPVH